MGSDGRVYVVRSRGMPFVLVAAFAAGMLFCALPWFSTDIFWWGRVSFFALGLAACIAAVLAWLTSRGGGLAVDRAGIWIGGYSLAGPVLVPWANLVGAEVVSWSDADGDHEALVLELRPDVVPPGGKKRQSLVKSAIERATGRAVQGQNLLITGDDNWDWNPRELLSVITQCIDDPKNRNALGTRGRRSRPADGTY